MPAVLKPCPICGRDPVIERCEPWPKEAGPQPWHVGCYRNGVFEHYIGVNGDSRDDAIAEWDREVSRSVVRVPVGPPRQEGRAVQGDRSRQDE